MAPSFEHLSGDPLSSLPIVSSSIVRDLSEDARESEQRARTDLLLRMQECRLDDLCIREDLWRLYLMIVESNGAVIELLDENHHLSEFLTKFFETKLPESEGLPLPDDVYSLAMWISWYTIFNKASLVTQDLVQRIRRFAMHTPQMSSSSDAETDCNVTYFSHKLTLRCPNSPSAAILLTFAGPDALGFQIPEHLGEETQQFDVLRKFQSRWMKLDISMGYQEATQRLLGVGHNLRNPRQDEPLYRLGMMEGSWIGKLVATKFSADRPPKDASQVPVTCSIREYIVVDEPPAESHQEDSWIISNDDAVSWCKEIEEFEVVETMSGTELHKKGEQNVRYSLSGVQRRDDINISVPSRPGRVLVAGESEDDSTWGIMGVVYFGQIRTSDGWTILKREFKDTSKPRQSWIFEGYVYGEQSFVGRWRPNPIVHPPLANGSGYRGIFKFVKRA